MMAGLETKLLVASAAARSPDWSRWPFGPGLTGGWLLALTKFLFIGLALAGIILLLRFLFGPRGRLRDASLDEEAKRDRQSRQESLDILRKRFAAGEIDEEEFTRSKRLLEE